MNVKVGRSFWLLASMIALSVCLFFWLKTEPKRLEDPFINILMCVKRIEKSNRLAKNVARLFNSILQSARRRPLRWIVLTRPNDVVLMNPLLKKIVAAKAQVPVQIEYVNLEIVTKHFASFIEMTRQHFLNMRPLNSSMYWDEVFHIGLVYHWVFPFERLIAVDADLSFTVDIADLNDQFEQMTDQHLIGIGPELTPHYWHKFRHHRKQQNATPILNRTRLFQGWNTGVLLLNLSRMRQSRLMQRYFNEHNLKALIDKYQFVGHLAYQDFFALLGMEHPQLIHELDCTWNRQLDESAILNEDYNAVFRKFHQCNGTVKVYHSNGGSLMPDDDFFPNSANESH